MFSEMYGPDIHSRHSISRPCWNTNTWTKYKIIILRLDWNLPLAEQVLTKSYTVIHLASSCALHTAINDIITINATKYFILFAKLKQPEHFSKVFSFIVRKELRYSVNWDWIWISFVIPCFNSPRKGNWKKFNQNFIIEWPIKEWEFRSHAIPLWRSNWYPW